MELSAIVNVKIYRIPAMILSYSPQDYCLYQDRHLQTSTDYLGMNEAL